MTISDFINEFETLLNKTKQYGSNMSSDILAHQLLKSANLSEYREQLTRATISDLNYVVQGLTIDVAYIRMPTFFGVRINLDMRTLTHMLIFFL